MRRMLKLLGIGLLMSFFIAFSVTFLLAYFSKSKSVLVLIDKYNEADFELAFLLVPAMILGTYAFVSEILEIKPRKEEEKLR